MTVHMSVHAIHAFEHLTNHTREGLGKGYACEVGKIWFEGMEGNILPILLGKTASLSILLWTQLIRCSM